MVRARFREGMDRPSLIEPGKIYRYTIDCWNTAQVFKAGHRIGLELSSSAFPKFDAQPEYRRAAGHDERDGGRGANDLPRRGAPLGGDTADYSEGVGLPSPPAYPLPGDGEGGRFAA